MNDSGTQDTVGACIRALGRSDPQAMALLLDTPLLQRVRRVLGVLLAHDDVLVEDALQEGCLKLWRAAAGYEPRSVPETEAWVLRIFANAGRDLLRRDRRANDAECAAVIEEGRPEPTYNSGVHRLDVSDAAERLKALLATRLQGRERRVLMADLDLDAGDGDTVLALRLATTKANLRTIRCRARKKLGTDRDIGSVCGKLRANDRPVTRGPRVIR